LREELGLGHGDLEALREAGVIESRDPAPLATADAS
jgi:hypothetical protein